MRDVIAILLKNVAGKWQEDCSNGGCRPTTAANEAPQREPALGQRVTLQEILPATFLFLPAVEGLLLHLQQCLLMLLARISQRQFGNNARLTRGTPLPRRARHGTA
jgi:hypothetical protein